MAGPTAPYYEDVRYPGSGGLRVPTEVAPASFATYKEVDLPQTTGTVALTVQQMGATVITATPTANMTITWPGCQPGRLIAVLNLAAATYSITCEIAGNTSNTAVVAANTNAIVAHVGLNSGMAVV